MRPVRIVLGVNTLSDTFKYYEVNGPNNVSAYDITDQQIENTIAGYVNGTVNLSKISVLNIICEGGGHYLALVSQNGANYGMALVFSFYLGTIKLYMLNDGTWRVISMATQS